MTFAEISKKAKEAKDTLKKGDKPRISVGMASCSRAAGADKVLEAIETELKKRGIEANITRTGCIGLCFAEPNVTIFTSGETGVFYGNVTPQVAPQLIESHIINNIPYSKLAMGSVGGSIEGIPALFNMPMLKSQMRIALRNCGIINPEDISDYIIGGGYGGLAKALTMKPDEVVNKVKKAGLRGRGGAGFPTGLKWEFCRRFPGEVKYLICNADEGDPGAFMDRLLLESDPHSVLEGMLIGAYAIGANNGYIYIRLEYPLAIERLKIALDQMKAYGLLGENIMDSGFSFNIKIKQGAGAFVCGEETALIASIEGKRGLPRTRPPYPAESGLWGKPTNINNVETWSNVPVILQKGADWFASYGTENSKGTKVFALAGKIKHTGLIEVPIGSQLRRIIYDVGGGIPNNRAFKAVQTGGPSGGCLPASLLDLPIDYDALSKAGSIMGSGGMVVMDEDTCMVDIARYFLTFTQSESCGKCVPCRLGTKQMLGILERICNGEGRVEDMDLLLELATSIKAGALCGLGQTAPNPVLSTLRYFEDEYLAHIGDKKCPAGVCKALITYYIDEEKCFGCRLCVKTCTTGAITFIEKGKPVVIDYERCTKCGVCYDVCKLDAVKVK